MSAITIIGVDCACDPKNVGLALATHSKGRTAIEEVKCCSRSQPPADILTQWISLRQNPILLALDAPLGWPARLGDALAQHKAGEALITDAHSLFRRETDRFIKQQLGKQTLDVGADRIARTAHAALGLLRTLRQQLDCSIPLIWGPDFKGVAAIEVYPAGTLLAHKISPKGYKSKDGRDARLRVLEAIQEELTVPSYNALLDNDDVLDAAVCVLAAHDFLSGQSFFPKNLALAQREGWIWVRKHEA